MRRVDTTKKLDFDKFNKIKALAERGFVGEKDVAKQKLLSLIEKHGLNKEDFGFVDRRTYEFSIGTIEDTELLLAIFRKISNNMDITFTTRKKKPKSIFLELTESEYVSIKRLYEKHKPEFVKYKKVRMRSIITEFIMKTIITPEFILPEYTENEEIISFYNELKDREVHVQKTERGD